ncbi:interferon regulatory factor 4-like isoform X2 [Antennarius striatus]|uniref:interferon regulatory factor 4-like isoform X2 n=1 Tax=Antennarius striatus TaxID=241820 RepID=UPI0035AE4D68
MRMPRFSSLVSLGGEVRFLTLGATWEGSLQSDASLTCLQAWALFKGKFREGIDKPDPPTWKTRLRCALNKSNDFEEIVERSQLDISDPYKVYRIIPEGAKKRFRQVDSPPSPMSYQGPPSYPALQTQMPQFLPTPECSWRDYCQDPAPLPELPFPQCPCPPRSLPWQGPPMENGYQLRASIYSYGAADGQPSPFALDASIRSAEALSDCRLQVSVFLGDNPVREVTVTSPDGCHITPCSPNDKHFLPPGRPEVILLPVDSLPAQKRADEGPPSPPATLEGGVLLWMGPDGLYARRQCQSSVYWQGGLNPYGDKPNKLDRDVNCKLLHTQDYITEIQSYGLHGRLPPRLHVLLSFGDECLDPQRQRRTLAVQVEPLFARQLLYYAQHMGGHLFRSYEHPGVTDHLTPPEDYQRSVTHHHSSSLQE